MTITQRIDNITRIPPERMRPTIPPPESVKIELTGRCNFSCSFCARSHRLREQKDMKRDFYSRVIREMRDAGVKELGMFYLGESMLCTWLPDAIREAKQVGFPYVFLTTNASLSNEAKVKACMSAGLDSLKFSYNYADAEQLHDIARVKKAIYATMQQNIRDAWKVREEGNYKCGLYASYIQYDGEQGERMTKAIETVRPFVDEVYALPLYNQASLVNEEEEARGWEATAGNRGRVGALRAPLPCWALFTEGHITWDGLLSGCCFDHNNDFTMADLNEVSFQEGWNSIKFQELRQANLQKDVTGTPCENCVAYN